MSSITNNAKLFAEAVEHVLVQSTIDTEFPKTKLVDMAILQTLIQTSKSVHNSAIRYILKLKLSGLDLEDKSHFDRVLEFPILSKLPMEYIFKVIEDNNLTKLSLRLFSKIDIEFNENLLCRLAEDGQVKIRCLKLSFWGKGDWVNRCSAFPVFYSLNSIQVSQCNGANFSNIMKCPNLQEAKFIYSEVNDEEIRALDKTPLLKLHTLSLDSKLSKESCKILFDKAPNLKMIDLDNKKIKRF